MKLITRLIFLMMLLCVSKAGAQFTGFAFTSAPQSWVGQGETRLLTPDDGYTFTAGLVGTHGFAMRIAGPSVWLLGFSAPNNQLLSAGTYLNAIRYPFQGSSAGLSFSGNGPGNNTLTGYFTVLEIEIGPDNHLESFAADFMQYDGGNLDQWNQGSIRFNSPIPVPEPEALGMFGTASLIAAFFGRRAKKINANHALQRSRRERRGCHPRVPCADGTTVSLHRFADAGALRLDR